MPLLLSLAALQDTFRPATAMPMGRLPDSVPYVSHIVEVQYISVLLML